MPSFTFSLVVVVVVLLCFKAGVQALECGRNFWTNECLGDHDKRYDSDDSFDIVDQSDVWAKRAGYFEMLERNYGSDFELQETLDSVGVNGELIPYAQSPTSIYQNITIQGTRLYKHSIIIMNSTDAGLPGYAFAHDAFGLSSFEKDGSVTTLKFDDLPGQSRAVSYPVGNSSIWDLSSWTFGNATVYHTTNCLDKNCNRMVSIRQTAVKGELKRFTVSTASRLTQAEYIAKVNQGYEWADVPKEMQVEVPMTKGCFQNCPTDEDFCSKGDPSCNESPYSEPHGNLTAGGIAVIVAMVVVALASVVAMTFSIATKRQERRYRTLFAKRIANTIDTRISMRSLNPSILAQNFFDIDESNNGRISKERLWNFLNGDNDDDDDTSFRRRDFEALWAVMDTSGDDKVDFLEFCAFFSGCREEYQEARLKSPINRDPVRKSIARAMAAKYKEVSASEEMPVIGT